MSETLAQFEQRKKDHIRIALDQSSQTTGLSGLDRVSLVHEALPEINLSQIKISTHFLDQKLNSPIFISSMTAGHQDAVKINERLARAAAKRGWLMGVGSQRKELNSNEAICEWKDIRKSLEQDGLKPLLAGNLGLSQVIQTPSEKIQELVDNLRASVLFIHTNPLQEALQKEGTPNFSGGLEAIRRVCEDLEIPVVLKEVGCGFSSSTLLKLKGLGLYAVDIAGLGGTHWGRVETQRSCEEDILFSTGKVFENWGISTVESLLSAVEIHPDYRLWASGGLRDGLDAAKLLAMGAEMVGVAQPLMKAAVESEAAVIRVMERLELELQIAMFCTGCENLKQLSSKKVWKWK